jgi:hypothetical protein
MSSNKDWFQVWLPALIAEASLWEAQGHKYRTVTTAVDQLHVVPGEVVGLYDTVMPTYHVVVDKILQLSRQADVEMESMANTLDRIADSYANLDERGRRNLQKVIGD